MSERITDERLAELSHGWQQQAESIHDCSLAGSMYQSSCNDTAAALRELQQLRAEKARLAAIARGESTEFPFDPCPPAST